ncbi:aminotransferase class I/II-fold pyridoxal phosphate-dependent enzyme [Streptomyces sp. TRM 70361]|uniref:aminotransferase class I/II-fold pyridoxal phosphate-dependent enzyme n=1 Tax=Streptomyces sp. TRM 70361 TaxID=3116553 RepID=UPI002E7B057E|nr:aminotransferase class I/II-fold pyridoxal phosphate-dependent enzyme [Streptomyces sp. TRM 70361]MEE1942545.1 aminotransferase class I/II-fold pyridoxal phosphate-dependent enzyme [Streptomyces sp. TRM 70361]
MTPDPIEVLWRGGEPETVTAVLRHHLEHRPDELAYRFLTGHDGAEESWTYRELDLRARTVAVLLQREHLAGRPVLLLHPPGLDYVAAFLGCLYAGAVAVPAYPPDTARFDRTVPRLAAIARDSGATHALTTEKVARSVAGRRAEAEALGLGGLRWTVTDRVPAADRDPDAWRDPGTTGGCLAFLQYTSGSTATPKGVMVGHANLLHNLRSIHLRLAHDRDSAMVSWLPPYHDMGLIGGILTPLYGGFPAHLMSPLTFLAQPLRWLETLSRTGASTSVAPNFGFEHCVRRITPEQRGALDLSAWRLALNGAEPVRADTLERFAEYFAPCGFDRRALLPCYGLAEATLMVTGTDAHEPPAAGTFASGALEAGTAEPAEPGAGRTTRVVDCGTAVDGVETAIVDPATRRRVAGEGRIGEIWVAGPSVARGYWRRPDATEETFGARLRNDDGGSGADGGGDGPGTTWLRTGDLGFLREDRLHVVGRTKDVVIVQGRNHYPHDIELTAERAHRVVRPGAGAAFGVQVEGAEELVVVHEIEGRRLDDRIPVGDLLARLRTAITEEHEVTPHAVVLVRRSGVPRTTSGKIRRRACRQDFLDLALPVVAAGVLRETPEHPARTAGPAAGRSREEIAGTVARVLTGAVPGDAGNSGAAGETSGRTFAELSLDYPRLLRAVAELERLLDVRVSVGDLLVTPTADALAGQLYERTRPEAGAPGGASAGTPGARRYRVGAAAVEAWLTDRIADRLGLSAGAIDPTVPFTSLGLDSRQAVAVAAELGSWLGTPLTPGVVFDHPTVRALAARLAAPAEPRPTAVPAAVPAPAPAVGTGGAGTGGAGADEPIAIIGMGCRFPGAPDPESYWRLLTDGRDAVGEVPPGRWDPERVRAPRHGGFVEGVDEFDARFFGISAREAERMDPQQRLLLETAWRTLEDAGTAPTSLAGGDTGVFVGISSHDYADLQMGHLDTVDVHSATGNALSVAANRVSYLLDLRGPSLAVDTACSSSLVAVHLACRSLRDGECGTALAGGVNLMATPGLTVAFAEGGMLAPGGRCRTFDDAADGYARGEGAGLVLLKPLSAALADGDRVHAVIRGTAVAHGGRGNGLTAPRGAAQRAVLTRALDRAGLTAGQIGYVEAHGTGTSLGDPVEWEALTEVYGRGRDGAEPCLVGSVKTSIGHLEAAAGIAGLIKAALVVRHRQVPPLLHLRTPNHRMTWEGSGLEVPIRCRPLPGGGTARAGVSSFGFGGANAHAVLEAAPERPARPEPDPAARPDRRVHALCLSAHTPTALTALAGEYRTHLASRPGVPPADLCHSANTGRAQLAHRAVVTGRSAAELDAGLEALVRGGPTTAVVRGHAAGGPVRRTAFLFSGQGSQYPGMGRDLYETHAGAARVLDRADEVLRPLLDTSLLGLLFDDSGAERLRSTRYCQPALVALEVALAELWASAGVRPDAVLGHSVGALGAACVAGVLSFEDALTLAAERGRHMAAQPGDGAMIACTGDAGTVRAAAAGFASVAVAAVNTPGHLVLSGEREEIDALRETLTGQRITVKPLEVSHAFHSKLMAGAAPPLLAAARSAVHAEPRVAWISDATGERVRRIGADHWVEHLLGTVRFADGFAALRRMGCDTFVEIGPHSTLLGFGRLMTAAAEDGTGDGGERDGGPGAGSPAPLWLPSLRRGGDDWATLLQSLGRLHCAGGEVDWAALDEDRPRERVPVPHAVFERRSYWFTPPRPAGPAGQHTEPYARPATDPAVPAASVPAPAGAGTVRHAVLGLVARVSGFPVEQLPPYARLGADLGFDSLMRVDLERRIAARFPDRVARLRRDLPEDPTVGDLTDRLTETAPLPETDPETTGAPMAAQPRTPWPEAPSAPAPVPAEPPVRMEYEFEEWAEYAELQGRLRQAGADGANPYGRVHEGFNSGRARLNGREVLNFAAFNYLALSHHPRVRRAAKAAIDRYGTSSSATPLLFGETPLHHELDTEIASFLGTEGAIVFAGGHATNVATVGHLFGPEDLIVHDEWIHDSTVRGCMLSGARRRPFPHNDWAALDRILGAMRTRHRRALVVVEGAYSQDGDIPDLPRFIEVKRRHRAMLMIDEAHSIGVLGATGRGIGEHFGTDPADVDLWMGTLSKAIGSLGGYIAARGPLIEYLKFTAPLHIFSTGISPANTAAALEAFRVIRDEPERVTRVRELSDHFRAGARARGLDIGVSRLSAVVPVITGDWGRTMALSNSLLEQGVNVMPIGYPAVERDKCRLRFFVNHDHDEADLDRALDLLV